MRLTLLLPLAAALIVSGCSDQEDDLRTWMTEASKDLKPNLKPQIGRASCRERVSSPV